MNIEEIFKDGINLLRSIIEVPSMLFILGSVLVIFGIAEKQPIAFFSGLMWVATDYAIFGKEIIDFAEEVQNYIGL